MAIALSTEVREDLTLSRYSRVAGVAMLLSIVFGLLGEMILPGRIIVRGDAAATAANILGHPMLFRLSFGAYLVEALCDVALCVFFYVLLRPVDRRLALLSALFGIASMVIYAVAQSSFFAASLVLGDSAGMGECPKYSSPFLLIPMALAGIPMMGWLLFRGIDPARIRSARVNEGLRAPGPSD